METLLELIHLCAPGKETAVAEAVEIAQSVAAGEGWEDFDIDPDDAVSIEQVWDAVCQSFAYSELMLFVDWKAYDEVVGHAQMLALQHGLNGKFEWDYLDAEYPTVELGLWEFARWLKPTGHAVCCPDTGGDSYRAMIVKYAEVSRVLDCAEKLGIRIDCLDPESDPPDPWSGRPPLTLEQERMSLESEYGLGDFQRFLVDSLSSSYSELYRPWLEQEERGWPEIFVRLEQMGDLQSIVDCPSNDLPRKARKLVQMHHLPELFLWSPDENDNLHTALTSFAWWFHRNAKGYQSLTDYGAAVLSFEDKTFLVVAPKLRNSFLLSLEMAGASIRWIERVKPRVPEPDKLPDILKEYMADYIDSGFDNESSADFKSVRRQVFLAEHGLKIMQQHYQGSIAEIVEASANTEDDADEMSRLSQSIADINYNKLSLHYSAGERLDNLRNELEGVVAAYEQYQKYLGIYEDAPQMAPLGFERVDEFERCMQLIGLCYLLHRRDLLPRIAKLQDPGYRGEDTLYEDLMSYVEEGRLDIDEWYHDKPYTLLIDAMYADTPEIASKKLAEYCLAWYPAMKTCPWHDGHLQMTDTDGHYFGYWAFEAGAVAFLLDLDDSTIDHMVYPKDLVAYARKLRDEGVTSPTPTAGRLRAEPNDLVPKTGWWHSPAKPNGQALHYFEAGQRFPDIRSTNYGSVIWGYDPNEQKSPPKK